MLLGCSQCHQDHWDSSSGDHEHQQHDFIVMADALDLSKEIFFLYFPLAPIRMTSEPVNMPVTFHCCYTVLMLIVAFKERTNCTL